MQTGKLLLLPNVLDETLPTDPFLPSSVGEAVSKLDGLIAESEKSARRYLRRFLSHDQMAQTPLRLLNEHTSHAEIASLLDPILKGQTWGLISDAGLPCIADPGSDLVARANQSDILVETFVGPCSIVMALQLSGFSGQSFTFHGYLPRESLDLEKKLKEMEKQSRSSSQIWIEAPYRSSKMLETVKGCLQPTTFLSVAASLTFPNQRVASKSIAQWKLSCWAIQKEPAIFILSTPV
jgi:16S rRNA (cytidine1402-2'-O)-methyltransferase